MYTLFLNGRTYEVHASQVKELLDHGAVFVL